MLLASFLISEASTPVSLEAHSGVLAKCPSVPKKYFLNNSYKEDYDESYASIYLGDISKLHIENKLLTKPTLDLLFYNYEEFKQNYLYGNTSEYIIFSSDFSEYTSYKVKDYSSNKSNLIKYDPMWFSA